MADANYSNGVPLYTTLSTGPLRSFDAPRSLDREQPSAVPGDEKRTGDIKIGAVSMQRDTGFIDTRNQITLPPMTIAEQFAFDRILKPAR